jgi:hypothetical protein
MKGTLILAVVVLLTICFLVYYFVCEGFQGVPNWVDDSWTRFNRLGGSVIGMQGSYGQNADVVCKAQQSCSACLQVGKSTDNHYGMQCGWCPKNDAPGAWKCIPRNGTRGIFPSSLVDIYSAYNEQTWPGDRTHQVGESCPAYSASNPDSFKYSLGQCPDACSMFSSDCRACASAPACGWCLATSKCVSRTEWKEADSRSGSGTACGSTAPTTGTLSTLTNIYTNAVCSSCIVTDAPTCPPTPCSTVTDCAKCANTPSCGWIKSISKCMKIDGAGKSISEGSADPNGGLASVTNESGCPCNSLSDCGTCAARPGCGFCASSKKCVNLDRNNMATPADCSPADTRTSPSQCPGSSLGWAIGEGKGYNFGDRTAGPGDSNISGGILQGDGANDLTDPTYINALKRWNGSVRGTGDGAVSPGATSDYVGGNGVVRKITDESIRGLNNSPDLTQSPIENYVRMLVRSELASEGIPMIEPFQSPSEVIGNADKFLKDRKSKLSK